MTKIHYTKKVTVGAVTVNTQYCGQDFFCHTQTTWDKEKVTCKNCLRMMKRNKLIE